MSSKRYEFRKNILEKIRKENEEKQKGGSKASDLVMKSLKTGCDVDFKHLKVELPNNKEYINNLNSGGGKNKKQIGGYHDNTLNGVPEFMRDNMSSVEPGKPTNFIPNTNLPTPSSCLKLDSNIDKLNDKELFELDKIVNYEDKILYKIYFNNTHY